jgi:sugar-phosphatase
MIEKISAIIFDLDGVIIDSNPAIIEFWAGWSKQEGFVLTDPLIREWVFGRKVGATIEGIFSHSTSTRKKEIEASAYIFDQSMQPAGILGIQNFVESLVAIKCTMGVATSSHYARMLKMLERVGVAEHFVHFITAHDVSKGKPDPEPYLKMAEKLGIEPAKCLVFEDANSGVQSAMAAGMNTIGIGNETTKKELLMHGAMEVIADFTEITCAKNQLQTSNGNAYDLVIF